MLSGKYWVGLLILVAVIAIAVALICWSSNHKGGRSSALVPLTADDVQTGEIMELALVTGSTGATNDSGFLSVLSTTIKTDSCTNRLYSNVSAFTSMLTLDVTDQSGTSVSSEVGVIEVRVLVDGVEALPGTVTFDSVTHVVATNLNEEEFMLLLEERGSVNSFQFVTRNVLAGTHTIDVQARAVASAEANPAVAAECVAVLGDRSLVVTQGRVRASSSSSSSTASSSSSSTTTA